MHHEALAFKDQFFDWRGGDAQRAFTAVLSQVCDMNEGRTPESNLNESALHAGQDAYHFAEVDIAHLAPLNAALKVQFLYCALRHESHACLKGRYVDQNIFSHADSLRGGMSNFVL